MATWASLVMLALPTEAPQNLLRNGGFEAGSLGGWDVECSTESCISPSVCSDSHSGRGAALLSSTSDRWTVVALRQDTSPAPRCTLQLSAWTRVDRSSEETPAAELQLAIEFFDLAGESLRDSPCRLERHWPGPDWAQVGLACDAPAAAERVRVWVQLLSVRSDAAALVDGVSLSCDASAGAARLATPGPTATGGAGQVPSLVHFIFGLAPDFGGKPFGLVHHLVVKAAVRFAGGPNGRGGPGGGRGPTVYLYHAHEPSGEWWDRTRPLLRLRHVRAPSAVFGRPLRRFAHQADVVRLEVLLSFGGVYLDLDVLLLAPLAPLMGPAPPPDRMAAWGDALGARGLSPGGGGAADGSTSMPVRGWGDGGVVLAQEGVGGSIGLGNAFMLTPRNHSFFRAWYDEYRRFSGARAPPALPPLWPAAPAAAACARCTSRGCSHACSGTRELRPAATHTSLLFGSSSLFSRHGPCSPLEITDCSPRDECVLLPHLLPPPTRM